MWRFSFFLLLLLCLCCWVSLSSSSSFSSSYASSSSSSPPNPLVLRQRIAELYKVLQAEQARSTQSFRTFPLRWAQQKGLYHSYIHFNFVPPANASFEEEAAYTLLRRYFAIPDSNMFVTAFVLSSLLEAHQLGYLLPSSSSSSSSRQEEEEELERSVREGLEAIFTFRDKNQLMGGEGEEVPKYIFWPQELEHGRWTAAPVNLVVPIEEFDTIANFAIAILDDLGLQSLAQYLENEEDSLNSMAAAFHIPSDLDDSSVNLALGGILARNKDSFPLLSDAWEKRNGNITSLFELELKYAYKPFQAAIQDGTNLLDTRSYYFLSSFLYNNTKNSKHNSHNLNDLLLGQTWLLDLTENRKLFPEVAMPFNTNNLDLSVLSNFLYGVSHAVLYSLNNGEAAAYFRRMSTSAFGRLFFDSASVVSWAVESGAAARRPDIALLYYPSIYDFVWMTARTARLLSSMTPLQVQEYPLLAKVGKMLKGALQTACPALLVAGAKHDIDGGAFWDDFLGDYGGVLRGEDRLFSSALALNALMDSYSTFAPDNNDCHCWDKGIPPSILQTVEEGVNYLQREVLAGRYPPSNAFFSGSMKQESSNPFAYPGTYCAFLNGTKWDPQSGEFPEDGARLVFAMKGIVSEEEYAKLLQQKWFGSSVPKGFSGFNSDGGGWPYWSSPAMTYSLSILAFSNYLSLSADAQTCCR
ncbi:hypothetical protein QOT17_009673 [Balamuthia mandrillaris]